MSVSKKLNSFGSEEQVAEVKAQLTQMVDDNIYNTQSSFSANNELYPSGKIPFVDKHIAYLMTHKGLDPRHYVSNLRLITKKRI